MPRLGRVFLILALGLVGLYLVILTLAFAFQRRLLFPAPTPGRTPAPPGQLLRLQVPDAQEVVALFLPPPAAAPVVAYFHGNAEELADIAPLAHAIQRAGLGVLAVEYPGYGLAPGAPTEQSLYRAAETALRHLHQHLDVPPARTVLLGQSVGTGVAAEMARRGLGARLALLSPYTSMPALAARLLPYLPARWLVRDRLDTAAKAPAITLPVLIVHGTHDELIPADMAEELARRFPHATLHLLPGAHHNDLWDQATPRGDVLGLVADFARAPLVTAAPRL